MNNDQKEDRKSGLVVIDGPNWSAWRWEIQQFTGINIEPINLARLLVGPAPMVYYVHLMQPHASAGYKKFVTAIIKRGVIVESVPREEAENLFPGASDQWVDTKVQEILLEKGPLFSRIGLISRDGDHLPALLELKQKYPQIRIALPIFSWHNHLDAEEWGYDYGHDQNTSPPAAEPAPAHIDLIGVADKIINIADHLRAGYHSEVF